MISLHIIVDNASDERLDRALLYLTRTKQTAVCIGGGAQLDRTTAFINRVRAAMPNIVIMLRILEDTGIVLKLTPDEWYARYVTPRLEWLQQNKITLVIDNETSGDDTIIKEYVSRSISIATKLHAVGITGAYCRFATGNIKESQYSLLKPLLDVLSPFDYVSPNEYSNAPGKSSGGHLERYKHIESVTTKKLNIAIGECGILNDYASDKGYRSVPMSGKDMAAQMLSEEMWYKGGSIPRFLFCIGGFSQWDSLQVGDDALEFLEAYYKEHPIGQPLPTPAPIPVPEPPKPPTPPVEKMITLPASIINKLRIDTQACVDVTDRMGQMGKQTGEQMVLLGQRAIAASRDLSDDLSVLNSFIRDSMST